MASTYLGDALGIKMDETGIRKLGTLTPELVSNLLTQGHAATLDALRYSDGWSASMEDVLHHPNGDGIKDMIAKWRNASELQPDELLKNLQSMVPQPNGLTDLSFDFLMCDYIGFHHDREISDCQFMHSIVILLEAPKGCKLLSNADVLTEAMLGDVFLLNDQEYHGAYPLAKTSSMTCDAMRDAPEAAKAFGKSECMTLLLVNRNINH